MKNSGQSAKEAGGKQKRRKEDLTGSSRRKQAVPVIKTVIIAIFIAILLTAEPLVMLIRNVLLLSAGDGDDWLSRVMASAFFPVLVMILFLLCLYALVLCSRSRPRRFLLSAGIAFAAGLIFTAVLNRFFHPLMRQSAYMQQILGSWASAFRDLSMIFITMEAAAAMALFSVYVCVRLAKGGVKA